MFNTSTGIKPKRKSKWPVNMKRLISLVIKEMQTKTIARYHYLWDRQKLKIWKYCQLGFGAAGNLVKVVNFEYLFGKQLAWSRRLKMQKIQISMVQQFHSWGHTQRNLGKWEVRYTYVQKCSLQPVSPQLHWETIQKLTTYRIIHKF